MIITYENYEVWPNVHDAEFPLTYSHAPWVVGLGGFVAVGVTLTLQPGEAFGTHAWISWFQKRSPQVMWFLLYFRLRTGSHK